MLKSVFVKILLITVVMASSHAYGGVKVGNIGNASAAKLLRPRQIRALSAADRMKYYRTVQALLVNLEYRRKRVASLFLSRALADEPIVVSGVVSDSETCEIGGYFGTTTSVDGKAKCERPDPAQIWESDQEEFTCGQTSGGVQKAYCNSAFFLYGNDSHERMCEPIENLSANCAKRFAERYKDSLLLAKDAAQLMSAMGEDELNAYHQMLEEHLNQVIAKQDPATSKILKNQLETLSSFRVPTDKTAAPTSEAALPTVTSKLLGKELSCIETGLSKLGHKPSERYLAFLAAGVQAYRGPFQINDPESLQQFRSAVISTVQAFGYCDEKAYPTPNEPRDVSRLRRLITAGNGEIKASGMDYVGIAISADSASRSKSFYELFGIRAEPKGLFTLKGSSDPVERGLQALFPDVNKWQTTNLVERQRVFTGWRGLNDSLEKSPFEKCQKDALNRIAKPDRAFDIEALGRDARKQAAQKPAVRDRILSVSRENYKLCGAMADSCGLDTKATCRARNLILDGVDDDTAPQSRSQPEVSE